MRQDHGHHPDLHRRSDPAPFSSFVPPCRTKPISKNRKSRSVFRLDPPSCALPPKKVFVPDPESVPTAIIFYFHHHSYCYSPTKHTGPSPTSCHPSTLLKTHSHRALPHRGAASFKSLYRKRPPQILMRLLISPLR